MSTTPIRPSLGRDVYIAPTAYVGGEVILGDQCSVWHHVTIRGDIARITLGPRVNVQDGSVLHTRRAVPLDIGADVSIGHRAVVHCRSVGPRTLIGTGAIILDDAEIGPSCIIGAAALVTPGTKIPAGKVALGIPAKVVRDVTDQDRHYLKRVTESYLALGPRHAGGEFPNWDD